MQEEIEVLKKRAVRGSFILLARKFFLRFLSFLGSVLLARLLLPEIFGIFAIVSFIVTFFQNFADVGLGAALIQKEKLEDKDLKTTFTLQQTLVLLVTLFIFFASPQIIFVYNKIGLLFGIEKQTLNPNVIWFLRALSLSLFFISLKTIPTILLERRLKFNRLVIPEIIEVISFQIVAVGLAYLNFGVWSFIIAVLARSFLGTTSLYLLAPWQVGFAWDKKIIRRILTFGVPYQLNYFIAFIKDSVTPFLVGAVSGAASVGFLTWAFSFSKLPLEFLSDIFRITFPGFSRIKNDKILIKKAVEKALYFSNIILFGAVFILAGLAKPIIHLVYTDKWLPALPAFYIHSFGLLVFGINSTLINLFWSLKKLRYVLTIMIISTIVNWLASVPLLFLIGYNGVMVASSLVLFVTLFLVLYFVRQFLSVEIINNTKTSFFSGLLTFLLLFFILKPLINNLFCLLLSLVSGGLFYLGFIYIFGRKRFQEEARWIISKVKG